MPDPVSKKRDTKKLSAIPDKNTIKEAVESARKWENVFAAALGIGLVSEVGVAFWFREGRSPLEIVLVVGFAGLVAVGFVGETIFSNKSDDASKLLWALWERETEELRRDNLETQARIQPRDIQPAVRPTLVRDLQARRGQKFRVLSPAGDGEAARLAKQICALLVSADWSPEGDHEKMGAIFWSPVVGVSIRPGTSHDAEAAGALLAQCLECAGVASTLKLGSPAGDAAPGMVKICVGSKPIPELVIEAATGENP